MPGRGARYTRYSELLALRSFDGVRFRVYRVDEYGRAPTASARASYLVVTDDDDLFWVDAAREFDRLWLYELVPTMFATYIGQVLRPRVPARRSGRCVVYAADERVGDGPELVAHRYGIRFDGDDSFWVVPAAEVELAPVAFTLIRPTATDFVLR